MHLWDTFLFSAASNLKPDFFPPSLCWVFGGVRFLFASCQSAISQSRLWWEILTSCFILWRVGCLSELKLCLAWHKCYSGNQPLCIGPLTKSFLCLEILLFLSFQSLTDRPWSADVFVTDTCISPFLGLCLCRIQKTCLQTTVQKCVLVNIKLLHCLLQLGHKRQYLGT